jgi:hypothetical protein
VTSLARARGHRGAALALWIAFTAFTGSGVCAPARAFDLRSPEGRFAVQLDDALWQPISAEELERAFGPQPGGAASTAQSQPASPRYALGIRSRSIAAPFDNPFILIRFERAPQAWDAPDVWRDQIAAAVPSPARPVVWNGARRLMSYADRVPRPGGGEITRLHASFFGRETAVTFYFSSDAERFDELEGEFARVLGGFRFDAGEAEIPALQARLAVVALLAALLAVIGSSLRRAARRRESEAQSEAS